MKAAYLMNFIQNESSLVLWMKESYEAELAFELQIELLAPVEVVFCTFVPWD